MKNDEYSIIIEFRYGIEQDEPFFELCDKLHERMEKEDAPGTYDGNEIAMDNFDARLYFYTGDPQAMLSFIDDILKEYNFLIGARINIRYGKHENGYTEVEIISPDGKRLPLSRFDADQLSYIPEWGDRGRNYDTGEEGDEWKSKLKNERAEKLYNKWKEIDYLIQAIWDKWDLSAPDETEKEKNKLSSEECKKEVDDENADLDWDIPKDMIDWHRDEMRGNSLIIPAKISGAEAGDLYILRMENAAIIRKAAMDIYLDCHLLTEAKVAADQDVELLRSEIDQFRQYFIDWVNGFEKDDYEDDWGLFT
jgi:hypothetical protein